jgi:uncharacterized membrane protein YqjE
MTEGNGVTPPDSAEKSLGEIVTDVSEKASLLVREEIELAKAEVQQKISQLTKGAAAAGAAATLLVFALIYLFHALAWFLNDLLDVGESIWIGYLITFGVLLLIGIVAGLMALRLFRKGAPPTPDLAIEEAKRTRQTFEQSSVVRDQVERGRERGEELQEAGG